MAMHRSNNRPNIDLQLRIMGPDKKRRRTNPKDIQHSNKNDNEPPTGNAHNNTPQGNRIYAHEARNKYEKNNAG